jgi:hypothetical protein
MQKVAARKRVIASRKPAPVAPRSARKAPGGQLSLGRLVAWSEGGPVVELDGEQLAARACAGVSRRSAAVGQEVVLMLDRQAGTPPVVLGFLQAEGRPAEAFVDGRRVELEGQDEIVLKCGEASITLRRNGRVLIKGVQVETRASGLNRIKGGSVAIN